MAAKKPAKKVAKGTKGTRRAAKKAARPAARRPAGKAAAGARAGVAWTRHLTETAAQAYRAADGLMALCEDAALGWKPATGDNWMTTGQLLHHVVEACGFCADCFEKDKWPDFGGEMLPPAEKLPAAASVAAARTALAKDKAVFVAAIRRAGETRLASSKVGAPWNPTPYFLAQQMQFCVDHLNSHKAQLFYYLKLQGKPVHTGHMYGMA